MEFYLHIKGNEIPANISDVSTRIAFNLLSNFFKADIRIQFYFPKINLK